MSEIDPGTNQVRSQIGIGFRFRGPTCFPDVFPEQEV